MPNRAKPTQRGQRTAAIRQSVTLPAPLAVAVRRVAKERHLTVGRALVTLVARGVRAETSEREHLEAAYDRFMNVKNSAKRDNAGKNLIRAVFGKGAIAGDTVR